MASTARQARLSPEEYLTLERQADCKSEYYDGLMFARGESPQAMAGASYRHGLILGNLQAQIHDQLKGGPCRVVVNDLRVAVGGNVFTYPDLVIVCDEPQFLDGEFDTLINPHAIIEVLSPTTESWDRGGKFAQYRRLESLRHYVLVGQSPPLVERYDRQPDDTWRMTDLPWPTGTLILPSSNVAVPLRDVYLNLVADDSPA